MDGEDQKKIIYHAIGIWPDEGRKFSNPLRPDANANCWFEFRSGYWRLVDWADRRYHNMNCYDILKTAKGITDWKQVLSQIKSIGLQEAPKRLDAGYDHQDFKRVFEWGVIDLTPEHIQYLKQWFPDASGPSYKGLEAVSWLSYNMAGNEAARIYMEPPSICFQLPQFSSGNVKFYMPLEKSRFDKWRTNTDKDDIFFEDRVKKTDICILSKSFMDGLLTEQLIGVDVFAFQGESVRPSAVKVSNLLKKYTKIYILYDADPGGQRNTRLIYEYLQGLGLPVVECYWPPRIYSEYGLTDTREIYSKFGKKLAYVAVKKALSAGVL